MVLYGHFVMSYWAGRLAREEEESRLSYRASLPPAPSRPLWPPTAFRYICAARFVTTFKIRTRELVFGSFRFFFQVQNLGYETVKKIQKT